jgi:replicative DNA helicase
LISHWRKTHPNLGENDMTQPPDPYDEEFAKPSQDGKVPKTSAHLFSTEAEEAICGCVLIDSDVYHRVNEFLKSGDFWRHRLRHIWDVFGNLLEAGSSIDILTVSEALDGAGLLDKVGGPAYVMALINQVPSTLNAESYARIIEGYSVRRALLTRANSIANLVYDEALPLDEVLKRYVDLVEQHVDYSAKDGTIDSDDASLSLMERILSGTPTGVRTGFPIFDSHDGLGGMPIGATMLMGDSSFGKSTVALQICEQVAIAGQVSMYMGFESTNDAMVLRRVANSAGVNPRSVRTATLTDAEKNNLVSAITNGYQGRYGGRLKFNSTATTLRQIEKAIRVNRPAVCVIDQISQVTDELANNPTMNLLKIFTRLKAIGNKYGVAMLIVHAITAEESKQFFERNKKAILPANQGQAGAKKQKNLMPDINAIPWASQIKFLSDAILFLVPEVNQQLVGASVYEMLIWIMKDRDGQRFEPTFWDFDLKAQWFTDKPNPYKKSSAQRPSTFTPPVP